MTLCFSLCLVVIPLAVIGRIYRYLYFQWCKRNLNGYRFYFKREINGKVCDDCSTLIFYATNKAIANLNTDENAKYFIKKVSEGCNWKSAPHKEEIYKGQQNFKGWDIKKYMK